MPIYEVRPERGMGRSRVLHRNLLMSCVQLPFEMPPQTPEEDDRRKQTNTMSHALGPIDSDNESEDEYNIHYEPLQPCAATTEEHVEPQCRPQPTQTVMDTTETLIYAPQPTGGALEKALTVVVDHPEDEELNLVDDHTNAPPQMSASAGPGESAYRLPRRQRRPPKCTTYDQLGVPSCCSIQPQLLPVYTAPRVPPMQLQYFQPSCMYGIQQA